MPPAKFRINNPTQYVGTGHDPYMYIFNLMIFYCSEILRCSENACYPSESDFRPCRNSFNLCISVSVLCVLARPLPVDRDPLAVYANNELKLSEIDVYGFDYDYTVACYNDSLNRFIYDMARVSLMWHNKACFCSLYLFVMA